MPGVSIVRFPLPTFAARIIKSTDHVRFLLAKYGFCNFSCLLPARRQQTVKPQLGWSTIGCHGYGAGTDLSAFPHSEHIVDLLH